MARLTVEEFNKSIEEEKKQKHIALYKRYGKSSIATIKKELPIGTKLGDYLTAIQAEGATQN